MKKIQIFKYLKKLLPLIIVLCLLATSAVYYKLSAANQYIASEVIHYNDEQAEQGLAPTGEKLDVNEEKNRLRQHLNYFEETMNAEGASGKKLGFIAQEIGREINTLGSKSNHPEMQKIVVMMKDELEQIKEQVLNVL